MDRNPFSDLEAVAAMPGLELLGDVIRDHVRPGRGSAAHPESILVFLAGRAAFGSANACCSAMRSTVLWEELRRSAARVGRELPQSPPTFNKLHHLRRAAGGQLPVALAEAFPTVAVPLAQQVGLLDPEVVSPWHAPAPSRVIYGDGSVFKPLTDVAVDEQDDTVWHGSRARYGPRVAQRYVGKSGKAGLPGVPFSVVGCHGRSRWQRVLLNFGHYTSGDEIGASMRLFERVIDLAGGGVSHVVYDRLMSGVHLRDLMKMGVVPVVGMDEAASNTPHLVLPVELRQGGYRSEGAREKRKGKGSRRRSLDGPAPKSRVQLHPLGAVEHHTPSGLCVHSLGAVDGAVVTVSGGELVTMDATYVDCTGLRWVDHPDGMHPIGTFWVPCRHADLRVEIDFAGDRPGRKNKRGQARALADHVRIIPEAASGFARIEGMRSDSESAFSQIKSQLPRQRASSLVPDHFMLDMLGAALLSNAIAWDVHVAHHTACAQHEARLNTRRQRRQAA